VHVPNTRPLIVDACGSSPTIKADVLAVPKTVKLPWVAIAPVEPVVVAIPFTMRLLVSEMRVVDAFARVVRPVTSRVPPVETFVLIVVEALTAIVTKRTPASTETIIIGNRASLIKENELFIIT